MDSQVSGKIVPTSISISISSRFTKPNNSELNVKCKEKSGRKIAVEQNGSGSDVVLLIKLLRQ